MKTNRHINRVRSFIVVGLALLFLIIFCRHNLDLMMTGYAIVQITMGLESLSLILLRITALQRNKNGWFYYFAGTSQVGLCVIDIILLSNQSLIKSSLLVFLSLNIMLVAIIFFDIYKSPNAKGNIKETPGSQTTHHENNQPGNRKDGKSVFGGNVERRAEALPENID